MFADNTVEQMNDYELIRDEAFKASGAIRSEGFPNDNCNYDCSLRKTVFVADDVRSFILESLKELGFEGLAVTDYLEAHAKDLFDRFKPPQLNLRMDLVFSNKCKKFHVDTVHLRSITTLIGPGTELQFINDPEKLHQIEAGETLLIKGKLFPGGNQTVNHRSPAIEHLEIGRLVFVIDY